MEPAEFAAMVRDVRQAQKAIGVVHYGATKQEKENRIFRKSIFVVRDIPRGEVFSEENIRVIRPGYGLHSREYDNVLGKKSLVDLKRGTPLKAEAVERYLELVPAEAEHAFSFVRMAMMQRQGSSPFLRRQFRGRYMRTGILTVWSAGIENCISAGTSRNP